MMKRLIYTTLFLLAGLVGMAQERVIKGTGLTLDSVNVVNHDYSFGNAVGYGHVDTPVDVEVTILWSPETGHIRFKSGDGWTEWYRLVKAEKRESLTKRFKPGALLGGKLPISSQITVSCGVYHRDGKCPGYPLNKEINQ